MNEVYTKSHARTTNTGASGLNLLIGIWLIISTFVVMAFNNLGNMRGNNVLFGILIVIFSLVRLARTTGPAWSWWNLIFGLWLIASPFVLGFAHVVAAMWHNIIAGIIVALLASHKLPESRRTETRVRDVMIAQVPVAFPDEDLFTILKRFASNDVGSLPVVSRENRERPIGLITRSALWHAIETAKEAKLTGD